MSPQSPPKTQLFKALFPLIKRKALEKLGLHSSEKKNQIIDILYSNINDVAGSETSTDSAINLSYLANRQAVLEDSIEQILSKDEDNVFVEKGNQYRMGFSKVYYTLNKFEEENNIQAFKDLKNKCDEGKGTLQELNVLKICRENHLIYGITKDIYKKIDGNMFYEDGEIALESSGGSKFIALAKPSMQVSSFPHEKKFFIGPEIIDYFWGVSTLGELGNVENSANDNMQILLRYMEAHNISDLHLFQHDETMYSLTGRQHTKLIQLGMNSDEIHSLYSAKKSKEIINQLKIEGNIDTDTNDFSNRTLISYDLPNGIRRNFRLHLLETSYNGVVGFSTSIRRLPREDELKKLEQLGYISLAIDMIEAVIRKEQGGLILISGKTNSGKTTLLNAILIKLRDEYKRRVVRMENPAETALKNIPTVDLTLRKNTKNKITNAQVVAEFMSHDPDCAGIGEARFDEEFFAAFDLARTGHLAFVTMHADSNEVAINRASSAKGVVKAEFNSLLKLGINQKLILKPCKKCKNWSVEKSIECSVCGGSRASGVLPVYDILLYNNIGKDDDITDTEALERDGKVGKISKLEITESYIANGLINNDDDNIKDMTHGNLMDRIHSSCFLPDVNQVEISSIEKEEENG